MYSRAVIDPVRIVPYDPVWPEQFEEERQRLEGTIAAHVVGGIHHVGSTAVPGLDAKPIIDILVGVESLDASRACFGELEALSYLYAPYRANQMHWFCKPTPTRRTHHLHLVPVGTSRFESELRFRDILRADLRTRTEYAVLKHRLATEFRDDREAYTEAKATFILDCLERH